MFRVCGLGTGIRGEVLAFGVGGWGLGTVLNLRTTTLQKYAAVPRLARI